MQSTNPSASQEADPNRSLLFDDPNSAFEHPVDLEAHKKIQDELVNDLTSMAQMLKRSGRIVRDTLQEDNVILERQIDVMNRNRSSMETEAKRLDQTTEKTSRGNWAACSAFGTVFLVFLAMVVLIRLIPKNHL
ncbi:putative unconventional SNARE in the endoplasmic reticulum protein 1 [Paratrimastix pyriformis]|uniref:Unconventional SNARE in the endoplasmic reticulum protein 1 n=1 Tax=Paratrimastix pyriformis TaxID=342808 RepID=A0ABQ8ULX4_9EUKA|nr:putative unconventional SNARE in the endoplasmic reticulum protein 1 [Paratrimastix pyriformis]